ncbi:MAG TPA: hypothetical protein P5342_02225, partial [Candidatus Cloacimonadota bacterium]|nr:hypothetical protein [Candidatus Cloacimonadota bacterium]
FKPISKYEFNQEWDFHQKGAAFEDSRLFCLSIAMPGRCTQTALFLLTKKPSHEFMLVLRIKISARGLRSII